MRSGDMQFERPQECDEKLPLSMHRAHGRSLPSSPQQMPRQQRGHGRRRRRQDSGDTEPPHEYRCAISHELMVDPVATAVGHTYEREAITKWLTTHRTDPCTNEMLPTKNLVPCTALWTLIW